MHHVTESLSQTLPEDYRAALKILMEIAPGFEGFNALVFPDFVERYGLDDWDVSIPAMALPLFKKDPTPIFQILEILKEDPEEYVRKSVANNLNDISKDHPGKVMDVCERWYGSHKHTDWIVKKACRTLLKNGDKRALMLFGFGDPEQIDIKDLSFGPESLFIGEDLQVSFQIVLSGEGIKRLRLEYGVDYRKAGNRISRKIFQIKEADMEAGSHMISRKHSFKDLSTRKHYPGLHQFTIVVNGVEKASGMVDVKAKR